MKNLLFAAVAAIMAPAMMASELPLDRQFTLNKGDVYDFTPDTDGLLYIYFEGEYPNTSLVYSNIYNPNFNPGMELLPYSASNSNPAFGQQSPAIFEIKKEQPSGSGVDADVVYRIVGPDETDIFEPANSIYSIVVTCSFEAAGEGMVLEPTVEPAPGTTLGYYEVSNISVQFTPRTFGVTCGDITITLFKNGEAAASFPGSELEMTWEYNSSEYTYIINLQNLLLYKLADSDFDKFTITLSDFNYPMAGDLVDADGNISLTYYFDQWHGMVSLEKTGTLPVITPHPSSACSLSLTYGAPLMSSGGEVQLLGTNLSDMNQEPSKNTTVYEPSYSVTGNVLTIDFSKYTQSGPVDDNGNVSKTDGYKTSGGVMTLIVRGFLGADGGIVQPVLLHLDYSSTDDPTPGPGDSGVETVATDCGKTAVFNLQGVKLAETDGNPLATLPSGLYIVNGKKIIK